MVVRGDLQWLVTFGDLLEQAGSAGASLVVIDTTTPGYSGRDGLLHLRKLNAQLKVLLVGPRFTPTQELAMLSTGVLGCCSTDIGEHQLRRKLSVVDGGGLWISEAAARELLPCLEKFHDPDPSLHAVTSSSEFQGLAGLTPREREIAAMVAEGDSNKVIAGKLTITDRTVKAHLTSIFHKLNIQDRLQLALYVNKEVQLDGMP